jgi:hypothetical protein
MTNYDSPFLYHKERGGKLRTWRIWNEGADIVVQAGQLNGTTTEHRKTATPKNVGRTDDGLPRFPIGKGLRAEEDMDL